MDSKNEALNLLNKIWAKLQDLPNASPVEIGGFFILLTFILVVFGTALLTCTPFLRYCTCCCRKRKRRQTSEAI